MDKVDLLRVLRSGRAPTGLYVDGGLSLAGTRVRRLPAGLTVRGTLDLRQCERLRHIGDDLTVGGDLLIGGSCPEKLIDPEAVAVFGPSRDKHTPLAALPSRLRVKGSIVLTNCVHLRELPESATLGGSITLIGSDSLARLPRGLHVAGDLTIIGGPSLTDLPSELTVDRDLRIVGTRIRSLPGVLVVGRHIHFAGCRHLQSLEGIAPQADLVLHGFAGETLPYGLVVLGNLRLYRSRALVETPSGLVVGQSLAVRNAPELTSVEDPIDVGWHILLRRCPKLVRLPPGLTVRGRLDLTGASMLPVLPRGLKARRLLLNDCAALAGVPHDLSIQEPIDVSGTTLRSWPRSLWETPVIWRHVRVRPQVVFAPETLLPRQILAESNAELRRVMLERAGIDRVLDAVQPWVIDTDRDAGGERRLLELRLPPPAWQANGPQIPARFLACSCPSTGRRYLLRVPVTVRTCHAAAAWLAGFDDPRLYRPVKET